MTNNTRLRRVLKAMIAASFITAVARGETPAALRGSAVESRGAGGDLGAALRAVAASGPVWAAWSVPMVDGQGDVCCYSGDLDRRSARRRGCRLDGGEGGVSISSDAAGRAGGELAVYARFEGGTMAQVRAYSTACPVEVGGARLVWLEGVDPVQSIELMNRQLRAGAHRKGPGDEALVALALHADPAADAALIALSGPPTEMNLREDAIFWLGQARGERGYRELAAMAERESDRRVLEKVAFSLSQSPVAAAGATLERMALGHRDPKVREEAIFWLGQRGGVGIAAKLQRVAQEDPDLEVRKKAVFALSQLDDGEGVAPLLDLVRHGREDALRREALFWLAQSDDPRAMESLEALLLKR